MRRSLAFLALVAACAPTTTLSRPTTTQTTPTGISTNVINTTNTIEADTSSVMGPLAAAWGVLPTVFDSLGIPVNSVDPATHAMGNAGFRVRARLKRVPLRQYLDCGVSQGGLSADTYEINLSVITRLRTGSDSVTHIATLVDAVGRPESLSGEYRRCSTSGMLERKVVELLRAEVRRRP